MNNLQIVEGIKCYIDTNGIVQLNLESIAKGLEIIKIDKKNNIEYKRINKQLLQKWLFSFGILNSEKDKLPEYVAESVFYLLSMKAENKTAKNFQYKVAYEILPAIRKTGTYTLQQPQNADDKAKLTEAKLMNAKVRVSNQLLKLSKVETLSKEYKNILVAKATEILTGEQLIPLSSSKQKTYSATDIANMFGVSANKIGSLANKNNLKTEQYGEFYRDKSLHSSKEIDSFRYYSSVIPEFEKILGMEAGALV